MEIKFGKPSNGEIQGLITGVLDGIEGITNTQVKTIATSVLNLWDTRIADYRAEVKTVTDAMQVQLDDAQKEADSFMETFNADQESYKVKYETDLPALQEKLDDEIAAHATFRTETEQAATNAVKQKLYMDLLTANIFDPDERERAKEWRDCNKDLLELDKEGKQFKDTAKIVADLKERNPESRFGVETQGGARTFSSSPFAAQTSTAPSFTSGEGQISSVNATMNAAFRSMKAAETAE